MTKMIIAIAAAALAFTSVASAKTMSKVPGTKVANPSWSQDRSYASTDYSFGGGSTKHEITTNLTNGGFFSGKQCKDCDSGTAIVLQGSYLRYLKDNFQVGGEVAFRNYSEEVSPVRESATAFDLIAVGAYNVDSDLKNSIFAKAGVGLYSVPKSNDTGYETQFGFFLGAGKRFAWLSNVSYTPELRLTKRGDIDMAVEIALINFSILWN